MDFGLSEEQTLLEKTIRDFLADTVPIDRVRELRHQDCPNDRTIWRGLAELGATGVLISEDAGGSALSLLDAALISQALGHAVTPSAFLSSAVIAPLMLSEIGDSQADAWFSGIASGELVMGVALTEFFSIREGAGVRLDGHALHGKAMMALDGAGADKILIAIDCDRSEDSPKARLAVVDRNARGLQVNRLVTTDQTRCTAELILADVEPEAVFENATVAIERGLDAGRIALAADVLGACESMIDQSVRYAGQRKQFGRLIGSFQAVKHMCAEMIAELEPARSLLWYAAHSFNAFPEQTPLLASHVLAHVSEIAREIASVSTQVHGGIGWTDEQNLHFWFKRIGVARHLLGGPEFLRERAASLQVFDAAS